MGRCPLFVLVALSLAACAAAPESRSGPALTEEQQGALSEAERLYRAEDPGFAAHRDRLAEDPDTAFWLTRYFVYQVVRAYEERRSDDLAFLQSIGAEKSVLHVRAMEQLRAMGPAAVPAVVQDLLRNDYGDRREIGAQILAEMGPASLVEAQELLRDDDWRVRRLVTKAAAEMEPGPESTGVLLRSAEDASFAVRAMALPALLEHGDEHLPRARNALQADPDAYVRREVAESLAGYGDRETAEALVRYLGACVERGDHRGAEAADASLQRISGYKRTGDYSFWRAWLASWPGQEQGGN